MRTLPIALLLGVVLLPVAQAGGKTYRWTDEKGRVHYGDISAPRSEQVEIRQGSGITAAVPTAAETAAAAQAEECKRRKDQLTSYSSAEEITETDAFGKTRSYTATERKQLVQRVQQQMQEACVNVAAP